MMNRALTVDWVSASASRRPGPQDARALGTEVRQGQEDRAQRDRPAERLLRTGSGSAIDRLDRPSQP